MPILEKGNMKPLVEKELAEIELLDRELHGSRRGLKALSKKKRKRFLSNLDLSEANEDNLDEIINKKLESCSFASNKKRSNTSIIGDWLEEEIAQEDGQVVSKKPKLDKQKKETSAKESTLLFKEKKSKINKMKSKKEKVFTKKGKLESQSKESISENGKELFKVDSEWNVPSSASDKMLVPNIFAKNSPSVKLKNKLLKASTPQLSPFSKKKVTIALKQNVSQTIADHIKQVRSSPLNPYDASKLPEKGLLKPNAMPSPIHPYYKKKLKLSFDSSV